MTAARTWSVGWIIQVVGGTFECPVRASILRPVERSLLVRAEIGRLVHVLKKKEENEEEEKEQEEAGKEEKEEGEEDKKTKRRGGRRRKKGGEGTGKRGWEE